MPKDKTAKKILLIEDDPFLVDIYTTKLKEAGFKFGVAIDGNEGLKKIKKMRPDLLILDIVLPQTDGWQILKEIKNNKNLKRLKVLVFSNLGQKEEVERGLSLGATTYLIKAHYTPTEVIGEIKKILK